MAHFDVLHVDVSKHHCIRRRVTLHQLPLIKQHKKCLLFVFVASSNKKSTSSPPRWYDKVTQSEENRLFHACFNCRARRFAHFSLSSWPDNNRKRSGFPIGSATTPLNNAKHGDSILAYTTTPAVSRSTSLTTAN